MTSATVEEITFTPREIITILFGLMLGMFLAALDQTIIATSLPQMARDLNGAEHLSWVISSYLLTSTATTPIYGKLSDLYGRKRMLQVAIVIFVVSSILCALAATMGQMIAFRAMQGVGGGGLLAMAHATIADVISPRERGKYQAYIASVFATASVAGPVLGGLFVDYLSWRWAFWINLPLGLAALASSEFSLRRLKAKQVRHVIDYWGALLIVCAVLCILLITTMGGVQVPWNSPVIFSLAGAALILFALCIIQERRASQPILPPRLFANPVFVIGNLTNLLTGASMLGGTIYVPLYLQLLFGLEAREAGLMLIPLSAGTVVGAVTAGRWMAASGRYKRFPLMGLSVATLSSLCLASTDAGTSLVLVGCLLASTGIGIGLVLPVMLVAVQNAMEYRDLGSGTASISFFRSMGGSFGVALLGAVLIAQLNQLLPTPSDGSGELAGLRLLHQGVEGIHQLSAIQRLSYDDAVAQAFHWVFFVSAMTQFMALCSACLLKEVPLRTNINAGAVAEGASD